jgi:hypothetical protein
MAWPDLFKHPLISLDSEDIQRQLDLINQNKEIDDLQRSVEMSAFYVQRNKVVGIDKT